MKEVLSVFSFGIGALCFAAFLTMLTPKPINAVPEPSKPAYCKTEASPVHTLTPARVCHMVVA